MTINRTILKNNAKAHNKYLTNEFLDGLTLLGLLGFVHPLDREIYHKRLKMKGLL